MDIFRLTIVLCSGILISVTLIPITIYAMDIIIGGDVIIKDEFFSDKEYSSVFKLIAFTVLFLIGVLLLIISLIYG